jgi:hypothetical protein
MAGTISALRRNSAYRRADVSRLEIGAAVPADNDGLLALTRLTPMGGRIALRIDRDPDFFALVRHRGRSEVFVALRDGEVAASFSITLAEVYAGGRVRRGAYMADLKARPGLSFTRVLPRLLHTAGEYVKKHDVELVWCVVAAGNQRVAPLFAGRSGLPPFVPAGRFIVDELVNIGVIGAARSAYVIDEASPSDMEALDLLRTSFNRTRELAPVSPADAPDGTLARLVARHGSRIVAALDLFDPDRLKHNVLLGAPLSTRLLLAVLRPVSNAFGGPRLPRIGEPVRLAYIRHFACEDQHTAAFAALVVRARAIAASHGFTFTAIGLHERDPLRSSLAWMPRFSFSSFSYVASLQSGSALDALRSGVLIQDYSCV